jgi:hypothetical protein
VSRVERAVLVRRAIRRRVEPTLRPFRRREGVATRAPAI